MARDRDRRLDAILAGDRLSGPERERVFESVLAKIEERPARGSRTQPVKWLAVPVLAAAAGAALLLRARHPDDSFAARGSSSTGAAALEMSCAEALPPDCPLHGRLVFRIHGPIENGYLVAYAEPPRGSGAERIWYFSAESESPRVQAGSGEITTLPLGVQLGEEHVASHYDVHLLLARRPLTQKEALVHSPADVIAETTTPLEVKR